MKCFLLILLSISSSLTIAIPPSLWPDYGPDLPSDRQENSFAPNGDEEETYVPPIPEDPCICPVLPPPPGKMELIVVTPNNIVFIIIVSNKFHPFYSSNDYYIFVGLL